MEITMSISPAPSVITWRVSATFATVVVAPNGKAITEHVVTPEPVSSRLASATKIGFTQTE